jgi:hypothetical protein
MIAYLRCWFCFSHCSTVNDVACTIIGSSHVIKNAAYSSTDESTEVATAAAAAAAAAKAADGTTLA